MKAFGDRNPKCICKQQKQVAHVFLNKRSIIFCLKVQDSTQAIIVLSCVGFPSVSSNRCTRYHLGLMGIPLFLL